MLSHCFKIRDLALGLAIILFPILSNADGKDIFLDKKCNKCHEVSSLGIQKLPKEPGAAADEEEEAAAEQTEKIDPPDLKGISKKLREEYGSDAAVKEYMAKYLNKEVQNKKEHKHKKKLVLDATALDSLVAWLLTL